MIHTQQKRHRSVFYIFVYFLLIISTSAYLNPSSATAAAKDDGKENKAKQNNKNSSPNAKDTLRAESIVVDESQYTKGATGACTIMALECAMRFQLKKKTDTAFTAQEVKDVLEIAAAYKSAIHTEVEDVMPSITRYKNHLNSKPDDRIQHQIMLPYWALLLAFVREKAKDLASNISCVVTKPPATIFIHFHFPKLKAHNFDEITPYLFDSHSRREKGLPGAHILKFDNWDKLQDYLNILWPKADFNPENLGQARINMVNIDAIILQPNVNELPTLNLAELQQDCKALAKKMEAKHRQAGADAQAGGVPDDNNPALQPAGHKGVQKSQNENKKVSNTHPLPQPKKAQAAASNRQDIVVKGGIGLLLIYYILPIMKPPATEAPHVDAANDRDSAHQENANASPKKDLQAKKSLPADPSAPDHTLPILLIGLTLLLATIGGGFIFRKRYS